MGRARIPDHRFRETIQRSALTVKGLTYMPTGATVAALTTSMPETPGGERNWDHRDTWTPAPTFPLHAPHWPNPDRRPAQRMDSTPSSAQTVDGRPPAR